MTRYDLINLAVAVVVFAIIQSGCATIRGSAAGTDLPKSTDTVTITRAELARIKTFKIRCRSKIAKLRSDKVTMEKKHKSEVKYVAAKAKKQAGKVIAACQLRLNGCLKQAKTITKCPSCIKPAVVAGLIAGGAALIVGAVCGVLGTLAITGDLK